MCKGIRLEVTDRSDTAAAPMRGLCQYPAVNPGTFNGEAETNLGLCLESPASIAGLAKMNTSQISQLLVPPLIHLTRAVEEVDYGDGVKRDGFNYGSALKVGVWPR